MGNSSSHPDFPSASGALGHHILEIIPNSPAHLSGLEIYFDYITHVNGVYIGVESDSLIQTLKSNVGKTLTLTVYSSKFMESRLVELQPQQSEYGYFLGCKTRLCSYVGAESIVWKVQSIFVDSPAERAGLRQNDDYIIGTPHTTLYEKEDLHELVRLHLGMALQLWVYNVQLNTIREVLIVPTDEWGGEGLLGCDIGYGYGNRIQLALLKNRILKGRTQLFSPSTASASEKSETFPLLTTSSEGLRAPPALPYDTSIQNSVVSVNSMVTSVGSGEPLPSHMSSQSHLEQPHAAEESDKENIPSVNVAAEQGDNVVNDQSMKDKIPSPKTKANPPRSPSRSPSLQSQTKFLEGPTYHPNGNLNINPNLARIGSSGSRELISRSSSASPTGNHSGSRTPPLKRVVVSELFNAKESVSPVSSATQVVPPQH